MPRNPKLMFQICQKLIRGVFILAPFSCARIGDYAARCAARRRSSALITNLIPVRKTRLRLGLQQKRERSIRRPEAFRSSGARAAVISLPRIYIEVFQNDISIER